MKSITLFALFILLGFTTYAQTDPQPPTYPGGETVMMQKLFSQITYPKYESDNYIEGVVYVSFFVEADGTTTNFKIARGVAGGAGLDSVALHACKGLGNFIPGKDLNGTPQKTAMTIPVRFSISDGEEEEMIDQKLIHSHAKQTCEYIKYIEKAKLTNDKKQIKQAEKHSEDHLEEMAKFYKNHPQAYEKYKLELEKCLSGKN